MTDLYLPTELERAEVTAARRALQVYLDTLCAELLALGYTSVMTAMGDTEHEHLTIVTGSNPGVVRHVIQFDRSAEAQELVRQRGARH